MIWSAIQHACQRADHLDFGKTDAANVGLRSFKLRWGAEESPLEHSTINGSQRRSDGKASLVMPALAALIRVSPPATGRMIGEVLYGHFG